MLSANPFSSKFMTTAFIAAAIAAFGLSAQAQEPPQVHVGDKTITGLPSDWSHRHVIYADPGTEQDAIKNGTHEQWDRIVHDPRYIIQRLKKDLPVRGPAEQDAEMRHRIGEQERRGRDDWDGRDGRDGRGRHHHNKPDPTQVTMHRDWSMKAGGSAADITLTVPAASASVTTFTVNAGGAGAIAASAPTAETATITFGSQPATGSSMVIGGITYTFTRTDFTTGPPASGCTVFASGLGTTTQATYLRTALTTGGQGTLQFGVTYNYWCATGIGANPAVTAGGATSTVSLTGTTAGTTGFTFTHAGTDGTSTFSSVAGTNGTSDGTHYTYWSGNTYDTAAQLATSLATSINANGTVSPNVTATANSPGSGQLTIAADLVGTGGNAYTVATTAFFTGGTFAGGTAAGNLPGVFPAKFSVSTASSVNCSGASQPDYVVYPTGETGSASSANIVAYDNIYASCGGTIPTVYWAYNTGTGSVVTSPILSYTGTQVAFIETPASGASTLRILKFAANDGTDTTSPVVPTGSHTNTTVAIGGNTAWSSCAAGSCMISVTFQTGGANPDTDSSPFYDFDNDVLYVGDDGGKLHKFSGVFLSTPVEVVTGGWPVTLAGKLTSPVIDASTGSIFIGSSNGTLYQVKTPLATPSTVASGTLTAGSVGILDSPIVDSTSATPVVYVFVGDDNTSGGGTTPHSAVYQFADNFAAASTGIKESMGNTTGSTTLTVYDGDFDNVHYTGNGTTGNLYFCAGSATAANPTLYKIAMNAGFTGAVTAVDALTTAAAATCSPATEFNNTGSGGTLTTVNPTVVAGVSTTLRAAMNNVTTTAPVTLATAFTVGDYALVDSEYMLIGAINTAGADFLTVTRGSFGAAVAHLSGATVTEYVGLTAAATTLNVASGASIQNGDYIQIDSEIMNVTSGGGTSSLTITRNALGTVAAAHVINANVTIPALDWLFLSVTANGNDAVCLGACLYSFYIGGATPATATDGLAAAGGTGGIIIDNGLTSDGASQVYYSTLSSQACTGNGTQGSGTGGCAVQASQAGLN